MHKRVIIVLGVTGLSLLFFMFTNPSNLPVGFLMVPILLAFGLCSAVVYALLHWFRVMEKQPRKQRGMAVLCGTLAGLYLVFQSTGGIAGADAILLLLIFSVSYIYITKY